MTDTFTHIPRLQSVFRTIQENAQRASRLHLNHHRSHTEAGSILRIIAQ